VQEPPTEYFDFGSIKYESKSYQEEGLAYLFLTNSGNRAVSDSPPRCPQVQQVAAVFSQKFLDRDLHSSLTYPPDSAVLGAKINTGLIVATSR
jgi:hypothetical protein